jgi:hypothetical protein
LELYQDKRQQVYFLRVAIGKPKKTWKNYRNSRFLMKYGVLPKKYSNAKAGAWSVDKLASLV